MTNISSNDTGVTAASAYAPRGRPVVRFVAVVASVKTCRALMESSV